MIAVDERERGKVLLAEEIVMAHYREFEFLNKCSLQFPVMWIGVVVAVLVLAAKIVTATTIVCGARTVCVRGGGEQC